MRIRKSAGIFGAYGFQANRISTSIKRHNREMEQIQMRPFPIVDKIFVAKSSGEEDYGHHMRLYYGNMDAEDLALNRQVYVRTLNPSDLEDQSIINESLKYKNKIYITYIHGNRCFVYNNMNNEGNFLFEYCSTRIELKNYKNVIMSIKANYLIVKDENGKETKVEGLEKGNEKYLPISENGSVDFIMCFVANKPEDTLCINDPKVYAELPESETDVLKSVANNPILKYKTLIFNFTFETVEKFNFTYELVVNRTLSGFETWTNYIPNE